MSRPPLVVGDRVVWSRGPRYGRYRGPGQVLGVKEFAGLLLAHVRFDDPGLDDEEISVDELERYVG